jgi:hypothetical protein
MNNPHDAHARPQIPASHRNLSRRPAKPARSRGRLQVAARRALWMLEKASTSDVIAGAYGRQLLIWGERRRNDFNRAVRRALESIGAVRVRRASTPGRPWIWRL